MASRRDPEPDEAISQPDWSAEQLGKKVRELRTERGLRLSDLARDSGLSVSFLSQVEQVTLEEGDSISFMSEDFRRLTNSRDVTIRLLWMSNQGSSPTARHQAG